MSRFRILLLLVCSGFMYGNTFAQVDYTVYQNILSAHVSPTGKVDYTGILKNDLQSFKQFLAQLKSSDPEKLNSDDQLAFWINTYNAFTIKLIIDHWPVKSIREIYNGNPWDESWIKINGKTYSLNQIEHDIIRTGFDDPRIHFAVNCAAKSCPPILNEPYIGATLDEQLDQQTRQFINNPRFNQLSQESISISKIFEWYQEDFGDLTGFLNKYSKTSIDPKASIRYTTYDWTLNN